MSHPWDVTRIRALLVEAGPNQADTVLFFFSLSSFLFYRRWCSTAQLLIQNKTLALHIVCFSIGTLGLRTWELGLFGNRIPAYEGITAFSPHTFCHWLRDTHGFLVMVTLSLRESKRRMLGRKMFSTWLQCLFILLVLAAMPPFVLVGCSFFSLRPRHWKHSTWGSICRWLCFLHICFN